ncbi:MAG: hypothetical protein A2201_06145 [Alicyclobacillus sp. RIFOXYA1_FULL_53_8]|nr:MAG: hypothetical protein A2201_06145 [Alicyclobacillus sp. RIFOXYA1_FULL_53_8]
MTRREFWQGCQVGATYIGTVVGAGFASGQEIYQFFGRYGNWGYAGVLLSLTLFYYLGLRLLTLGHRLRAQSYREMNEFLFGAKVGRIVDFALLIMLFGVIVAMLAGAGELFKERLHLSFQIGVLITAIVTYFTVIRGMSGVLRANLVIVPVMVTFVMLTFVQALLHHGWATAWQNGYRLAPAHPVAAGLSALVYVAFNVGLATGVLVPLGHSIPSPAALRFGAKIGAVGLGGMLLAVVFTLFSYSPAALQFSLPMAYVATKLGTHLQWGFVLVLWAEIFSTLVGNVYALGTQWTSTSVFAHRLYPAMLLAVAYAGSQIGFAPMVKYAYTVFGLACVLIVLALLWPREQLPEL